MKLLDLIRRHLESRRLPRIQRRVDVCIRHVDRLAERKLARAIVGGWQ